MYHIFKWHIWWWREKLLQFCLCIILLNQQSFVLYLINNWFSWLLLREIVELKELTYSILIQTFNKLFLFINCLEELIEVFNKQTIHFFICQWTQMLSHSEQFITNAFQKLMSFWIWYSLNTINPSFQTDEENVCFIRFNFFSKNISYSFQIFIWSIWPKRRNKHYLLNNFTTLLKSSFILLILFLLFMNTIHFIQ